MDALPFCVFKRNDRPYYLVKFKDDAGNYLPPVSTKKKDKNEAIQVAFKWLRDGIPQKNSSMRINVLSLKDMARKIKSGDEVETLQSELKRLGWVKSYLRSETPGAVDFVSFLKTFWDWETSPYVNEKLRKSHSIHKRHCSVQRGAINLYWEKFFTGRFLGDITAEDIDSFINYIGDLDLSASRKNGIIKAGTKPLRWAYSKGKIEKDPTRGHILFSGDEGTRNILTPNDASAIFSVDWSDDRVKIANMLAAVTGMRNGEIVALKYKDIGSDCLYVHSSYNSEDKIKTTKNNEARTVEIPFPFIINGLIELAKLNPWGVSADSFIFWSTTRKKSPMQGRSFGWGLREALVKIGFTEDEAEEYDFHGWRHFFTSYMIKKLNKKLLKEETGHKTDIMLEHYGNHLLEGEKEIIRETKKEVFAGLLPERKCIFKFKQKPLAIAS